MNNKADMIAGVIAIAAMVFVFAATEIRAGDMVDVSAVVYSHSRVVMGAVTIDTTTGNVTIKEGVTVDDASAGFWAAVEKRFESDAKIAESIRASDERRVAAESGNK